MSALSDYTALCASHEAIRTAPNLQKRLKAVADYHGDLARFVFQHPNVLKLGVEALLRAEAASVRTLT